MGENNGEHEDGKGPGNSCLQSPSPITNHHTTPIESAKLQLITILPTKAFDFFFHLLNNNPFLMTLLELNDRICYKVNKHSLEK
ncbi:unnamed protein product [Dovyalis caffra]|uniref:Uncharacterized protein n=1 Tax=Dovyalis caffra TaxID=77055 RepID=A0AAV1RUF1_9ROSI|nr:unnamed protein product [Dovyalis caffra]